MLNIGSLPKWVVDWKSSDETTKTLKMKEKLNFMFSNSGNVGKIITAATELIEDLDNIVTESGRPAYVDEYVKRNIPPFSPLFDIIGTMADIYIYWKV